MYSIQVMRGNPRRVLWLVLLFALTFALPLFFGLGWAGALWSHWSRWISSTPSVPTDGEVEDRRFPGAFEVSLQGSYLRVPFGEDLQPVPGEDYLLLVWFNLKKLPSAGQNLILLSKYDPDGTRLGFAIALARENKGLRPLVYWADTADAQKMSTIRNASRWYEFPELELSLKGWFLCAMSFHDDRFLGLHIASFKDTQAQKADLQLLGGYDVGGFSPPFGTNDIVTGAFQDRAFRGMIGPLAIVRGPKLAEAFKDILKQSVKDPLYLSNSVGQQWLKLWVPDQEGDLSRFHAEVDFHSKVPHAKKSKK